MSGVSIAEAGVAGRLVDASRDHALRAGKGSHSMSGNGPYEKNAVPGAAGRPSRLRGGPGLAGGRAKAGSGERNSQARRLGLAKGRGDGQGREADRHRRALRAARADPAGARQRGTCRRPVR